MWRGGRRPANRTPGRPPTRPGGTKSDDGGTKSDEDRLFVYSYQDRVSKNFPPFLIKRTTYQFPVGREIGTGLCLERLSEISRRREKNDRRRHDPEGPIKIRIGAKIGYAFLGGLLPRQQGALDPSHHCLCRHVEILLQEGEIQTKKPARPKRFVRLLCGRAGRTTGCLGGEAQSSGEKQKRILRITSTTTSLLSKDLIGANHA